MDLFESKKAAGPSTSEEQSVEKMQLEMLEKAEQMKNEANQLYMEGEYGSAVKIYHRTVLLVRGSFPENVQEMPYNKNAYDGYMDVWQRATDLINKIYNNLAACIVNGADIAKRQGRPRQTSDFQRAINYCDKVLQCQPENQKALFRKAQALYCMEEWEKALHMLYRMKKPNPDADQLTLECRVAIKNDNKKRNDELRSNFERARNKEKEQNGTLEEQTAA